MSFRSVIFTFLYLFYTQLTTLLRPAP